MPEREKAGRKAIEEVQQLRARVAKLERIALRKAGHKDADRELDRAWSEWETTFDAIGDSVILLDSEFNIVEANAATSSLLGKPLDEIVGQRCCKLVHGSNEPPENCPLAEAKTTKKRQKAEFYIAEKGIWALVSVDPFLDDQGNLTGAVHTIADITKRKRAEEKLKESEERYRVLFEGSPDGIIIADVNNAQYIYVNSAICKKLGYSDKEIKDLSSFRGIHPKGDVERIKSLFFKQVRGEIDIAKDIPFVKKDGTLCYFDVNSVHLEIDGIQRVVAILRDITDRKRAEEVLRETTQTLEAVIKASPLPIFALDRDRIVKTWNPAAERTFGWSAQEVIGRPYPAIPKEKMDEADALFLRALESGLTEVETIRQRKDGSLIDVHISAAPLRDASGNITGVMAVDADITERKKAEQQIAQSEQKYKELFESASEAIIIIDLDGKITDANRTVEEYGHTRDYLLGKSIFDFIPVNHRARAAKDFDELCHGTPVKGEMEVIAPKGNLTVEYRDNPIVRGGQIVAIQAILMDITERKMVADKLMRLSRVLKMIAKVNQDMFLIRDREKLLRSICSRIVGHPYKMVWIGFCDEPTKKVAPAAQAGFEEGYLDSIKVTYDDSEYGRGPTGTAIRTNKPCVVRSTAKDPAYEPWRKEALKRGYRSSAAIPIVSGERVIGALNVYSEKEDAFGDEEITLLEELAHDISIGLRAIDEEDKRIEAQKKLKTYQKELRSLASELALAEERERHRIAAGIHDGIGQKLALAKMELQLLARPPGKSRIPASLDSVCARIDEAIKDAHSLTFELGNPALYDLSFEAAIDLWLLERIQKKHGIKCTVIADEQPVPLDEDSKVVLFRALRELAVNVVKHAKAATLTVTIEKLEGSVQITCKDDGLGFTPPEWRALPRDVGGFGLFNIKERLEHLGGGMKLQSAPGCGTLVTLSLPLERQNDAGADEGRQ